MRKEQRKQGERPIKANPGASLVVKTLPSDTGGMGSIPVQRVRSHVSCSQKPKQKTNNIVTNSIKTFKMVHIKKSKTINKMAIGTHISTITLNVNSLNAPTKRQTKSYICCLQETPFRSRDTYRLKVRAWKKIVYANGNQKKARDVIFNQTK